ncbi:transducin-like enhancer protein 4 [Caerostris darwini]|uniref:Transducin-like enhancer protein 4 n=1 Tax=Caerostris darwini TaxID=1538125 RepID=A0AAV4WQE2_9ARAC|nr:transducin-like enhancer protein 4 [Caerostris darwini]
MYCFCVCTQGPPPAAGQPFKFTVAETCDRIKEEFSYLQAQYHRDTVSLKLECEKLASEKTEMQRHYVMYYEMSYGLNVEMHKQNYRVFSWYKRGSFRFNFAYEGGLMANCVEGRVRICIESLNLFKSSHRAFVILSRRAVADVCTGAACASNVGSAVRLRELCIEMRKHLNGEPAISIFGPVFTAFYHPSDR